MFYVIEISKGDSKIEGFAIYSYSTREEAIGVFHQKMSTAYKSALYTHEQCMVIDDNNVTIAAEVFNREVVAD